MSIDVTFEIDIGRARADVAAYVADPANATEWYAHVHTVTCDASPPLPVGATTTYVARFIGSTLKHTYEVRAHEPGERFVMESVRGPFPVEVTYTWADTEAGGTLMTLHMVVDPPGVTTVVRPLLLRALTRALKKDTAQLAVLLEAD